MKKSVSTSASIEEMESELYEKEKQVWMARFGLTEDCLDYLNQKQCCNNKGLRDMMEFLAGKMSDGIGGIGFSLDSPDDKRAFREVSAFNEIYYFISLFLLPNGRKEVSYEK